MNKRILLVANPNAGARKAKAFLPSVVAAFRAQNCDITVLTTEKRGDATEYVRSQTLSEYDILVSCGGDGTLSEVVNGLAGRADRIPLGCIPAGTTNDFAMSIRMPRDVQQCVNTIVCGRDFPLDVGAFNDRYFIYIAAFGLFTSVAYSTPQKNKQLIGHMAYLLEGIKQVSTEKSRRLRIECNGEVYEDDFIFGAVANTFSIAGLLKLDESMAKLDDGEFEVALIRDPHNLLKLQNAVLNMARKRFQDPNILFLHSSEIRIQAEQPLSWCLDGEDGAEHTEAVIRNHRRRIVMRLPLPEARS